MYVNRYFQEKIHSAVYIFFLFNLGAEGKGVLWFYGCKYLLMFLVKCFISITVIYIYIFIYLNDISYLLYFKELFLSVQMYRRKFCNFTFFILIIFLSIADLC